MPVWLGSQQKIISFDLENLLCFCSRIGFFALFEYEWFKALNLEKNLKENKFIIGVPSDKFSYRQEVAEFCWNYLLKINIQLSLRLKNHLYRYVDNQSKQIFVRWPLLLKHEDFSLMCFH